MRRLGFASLALFLTVLAACSSDPITPSDGSVPGSVIIPPPQPVNEPSACSAEDIETHLTALMAVVTPNDNSALSKFNTLKGILASGDIAAARDFAQNNLIKFITTKFGQAPQADQDDQADEFEQVKAEILCFVGLFTIPRGNLPKVVVTSNQLMGIWFPEGFCPEDTCGGINVALDVLTACTSPGTPAGCTPAPFGTVLDLYGNYLKVTLTGGIPDFNTPDPAVVAMCAPAGTEGILTDLRILHQDDGTSNTAGLDILDGTGIPEELDDLLLCDTFQAPTLGLEESAPNSMFARMVNHLADLLLPEKASANMMFLGGLGIGGSTRQFSPFVIGSTGLTATGIGGSTRQFAPANPDAPAAAAPALATDPNGNLIDSVTHKQTTDLPGVFVKTGQGTAIPGATVTFSMLAPVTAPYNATPSSAYVCDGTGTEQPQIVATTDANGFAALGCVNFGTTVGFKNLQASVNPATATGVAGGGITEVTVTACDPVCGVAGSTTTLNWLVETTAGNADRLSIQSIATTAAAGSVFGQQPVLRVLDRLNNVVLAPAFVVTPAATGPTGSTGGLIGSSTPSSVNGFVNFSGLGIGGTAGTWKVKFTAPGSIKPDSANVIITAGTATTINTLMPPGPVASPSYSYAGIVTAGAAASPVPQVVVKDQYGNGVGSETVSWAPVNSTLVLGSGGTTNVSGIAQLGSWTPGIGESTLLASVSGINNPATFSATSALGASVFLCELGTADGNFLTFDNSKNKSDLAPIRVADPKKNILDLFLYMSVTGQSNTFATYNVDLKVYRTANNVTSPPTSGHVGSATGTIAVPGNNGQAQLQHIKLTSPVIAGTTNNQALWFVLTVVNGGSGRTFQVWRSTLANNRLSTDCKASFLKTGSTLTAGAGIMLKN